jgi:cytochrome c nitrite reductase small subunit
LQCVLVHRSASMDEITSQDADPTTQPVEVVVSAALSISIAILLGGAAGIGAYTFSYAEGTSYLTDDAQACANCHVMEEHLNAWAKSSHGKFATCNDCHAPHDFVGKYYCKSRNGLFHSYAFTTGDYPNNIRILDYNRRVVEDNCRHCHQDLVDQMETLPSAHGDLERTSCIKCHADVGHDT